MESKRALTNMPNNQLIQSQLEQFVQNITELRASLHRLDEINKKYNILNARTNLKQGFDERIGSNFNPKQNLILDQRNKVINMCESNNQGRTTLKNCVEQDFETTKSLSTVSSDISAFDSNTSSPGESPIIKNYPNLKLKESSERKICSSVNCRTSTSLQGR